jgi:NADH-quinone oxidoreductase subunit N
MWVIDVYEGSAFVVSSYFALIPKIVILQVLLFICTTFNQSKEILQILLFISILSIIVGSLGALFQYKIKRFLAYSSVSHMGFLVLPFAEFETNSVALIIYFYVILYLSISYGLWFIFMKLENQKSKDSIKYLSDLSGLYKTNSRFSIVLAILFFSLGGLPPLSGFYAKFFVLYSTLAGGNIIYGCLFMFFSSFSVFYCIRFIKILFFDKVVRRPLCFTTFDWQISFISSFSLVFSIFFFFETSWYLLIICYFFV